jgi:hypothetical protein
MISEMPTSQFAVFEKVRLMMREFLESKLELCLKGTAGGSQFATPVNQILCGTITWLGRNQSNKPYFTAETRSSQRSEYLLINNSLLCVLGASAVNSLLKRYNQNSHPKFAKAARAFTYNGEPAAGAPDYLVPSQPCSDRSIVTPSGPLNLTSTLPRFAISSVPG